MTLRGFTRLNVKSVSVHRYRHDARTDGVERFSRTVISWILHPGRIAAIEKNADGEIESLLRSAHDEYLRRIASHAARRHEIVGNHFSQRGQPARRSVRRQRCRRPPPTLGDDLPPRRVRELIDRRNAERKCARPNRERWRRCVAACQRFPGEPHLASARRADDVRCCPHAFPERIRELNSDENFRLRLSRRDSLPR
jgi:hypothetical protein